MMPVDSLVDKISASADLNFKVSQNTSEISENPQLVKFHFTSL